MQYELTKEERQLIHYWRSTDDQGRRSIMAIAEVNQGWNADGTLQLMQGTKPARLARTKEKRG